jgi:hypothetical protein
MNDDQPPIGKWKEEKLSNVCPACFDIDAASDDDKNKEESAATSKKAVDETELMAVTCFHGIGVRYLNLFGGNERYCHAMRLPEAMHADCPEATQMRVCYDLACDLACEFESTVRDYDDEWLKDVSVRIGPFHLYGHQLRCHILYNLLRTEGFVLMVGKEVEQRWSIFLPPIASSRRTGRVGPCRAASHRRIFGGAGS